VSRDQFDGFEWDEEKSDLTLQIRGIAFEFAARVFDGDYIEHEDRRRPYGEQRFVATGEVDGFTLTVVWTPRPPNRRIIAAWPASPRETRTFNGYRQAHKPAGSRE
jgi:uncharacterized DUF497 family protein